MDTLTQIRDLIRENEDEIKRIDERRIELQAEIRALNKLRGRLGEPEPAPVLKETPKPVELLDPVEPKPKAKRTRRRATKKATTKK